VTAAAPHELAIPDLCLVVLVGVSGSGKSTFAQQQFRATEVISSDSCRALVSDDASDQSATRDAFDVLNFIAGKRLAAGRLTVIDATSVQPEARRSLIALAREHHVLTVAIVLDVPEQICAARNAARPDRNFGAHVVRQQRDQLRRGLRSLRKEGFRARLRAGQPRRRSRPPQVHQEPLYNDLRTEHRAVRCHRGRPRLLRASWRNCSRRLGYAIARTPRDGAPARIIRAAGRRCSSATWWTAGRPPRRCCGW
jgi:protein phosphatase